MVSLLGNVVGRRSDIAAAGRVGADMSGAHTPTQIGGYEVCAELGRGAGSTLYKVRHPQTRRELALKHVQPQTDRDQRFVDQLVAEHAVASRLGHPGLRRAIELRVHRSLLRRKATEAWLVLDLVQGHSLQDGARGAASAMGAIGVFVRVADAMSALHAAGYVHCDLKPNNILVGRGDRTAGGDAVTVIDFGQACPIGTKKPRVQGTPDYIAPEQVRCEPVTPATDVYNLGATMYWCLTGRNFPTLFTLKRGDNSFLLDQRIPTPAEADPTVPPQLSALVMECVRSKPAKRPQSMRDVVLRLEIARHVLSKRTRRTA
jgi:serine/threonine-protein kinase